MAGDRGLGGGSSMLGSLLLESVPALDTHPGDHSCLSGGAVRIDAARVREANTYSPPMDMVLHHGGRAGLLSTRGILVSPGISTFDTRVENRSLDHVTREETIGTTSSAGRRAAR